MPDEKPTKEQIEVMQPDLTCDVSPVADGLFGQTQMQQAYEKGALYGGDGVIEYLQHQHTLTDFIKHIAADLTEDSWQCTTNINTGMPVYYIAATVGGILCKIKLKHLSSHREPGSPTSMDMLTTEITIGDSLFTGSTIELVSNYSFYGVLSSTAVAIALLGYKKSTTVSLELLFSAISMAEQRAAMNAGARAMENVLIDGLLEAAGKKLKRKFVIRCLARCNGYVFAILTVIAIGSWLTKLLFTHTTVYDLRIQNKTKFRLRWHEPNLNDGVDIIDAPINPAGGYHYIIPEIQNTADDDEIANLQYSVAPFVFGHTESFSGISGNMHLEFIDEEDIVVGETTLYFKIPYSGPNSMAFDFKEGPNKSDTCQHGKDPAWSLAQDGGLGLTVNGGMNALQGKHTLPNHDTLKSGYNYASTVIYQVM
ncbi:MAG: hypothetical protein MJK04_22140 [Psychrosphaera sp.]|nr:hypothetical protein [Psychrosphaera sp.]